MNPALVVIGLVGVLYATFWLTGRLRDYATARQIIDVPNARSSHSVPTPRGGGAAIVVTVLGSVMILGLGAEIDRSLTLAVTGGGILVAVLGFVDDHRSLSARVRLAAHFAAAVWIVFWLGAVPIDPTWSVLQEPVIACVAVFYLVWLLNLTNFMDGIDGLAAVEVITVCLGSAVVALFSVGFSADLTLAPMLVATATTGFLVWNWPPARVFMGDVGSGFLGLVLGAFSLFAGTLEPLLFWGWLILLGVFVVDATLTLTRRLMRGEAVYRAHRSHAYQQAARRCGSHRTVTISVGLINVGWLLPIAFLVVTGTVDVLPGLLLAYVPLSGLALYLGAGEGEPSQNV